MIVNMTEWIEEGGIYAGSNGSVEGGKGAHSYMFIRILERTTIWGGLVTTPGSEAEMASLWTEHTGSITVLLILHILQKCLQMEFSMTL